MSPRPSAPRWHLVALALALVCVYANSLSNPFVFDDHATIVSNPQIRSLRTVFSQETDLPLAGRPLPSLTFALNYAAGGVDVTGYRLVNLAIHVACALLLCGVVRRTLELPALAGHFGPSAPAIAFATALLWGLHPLTAEVINYISQRTESLMACAYLATAYASIRALSQDAATAKRWARMAVGACATGMLCKESMVTAPIAVVLYDGAFAFPSIRDALRARRRYYAALASTWVIAGVIVLSGARQVSGGAATTVTSVWSYLLNQGIVVTRYLELVVWPRRLVAYYGWATPMTLERAWPYVACVAALLLLAVWVWWRRPRAGFLPVWTFLALAPASSFVPVAVEVGAERRMYLPLAALMAMVAVGVVMVMRRRVKPAITLLTAGAVALGARTVTRDQEYASELGLAGTLLERWPSGAAHHTVAMALVPLGRHEEAVRELRAAAPDFAPARYDLGVQLFELGRYDESAAELRRFLALEPRLFISSAAHTLLARIEASAGRPANAEAELRAALAGPQTDPAAHGLLADLLLDRRAWDAAIAEYRACLAVTPDSTTAFTGMGIAFASSGRPNDAVAAFRRVVDLQPADVGARENLAQALLDTGSGGIEAAVAEAQTAVRLAPTRASAHDLLGQALAAARRTDDARRAFERATSLDATFTAARAHLAALGGRQ